VATSNSTDFDQPATEIIKDALILIGGIEDDETPTDSQLQYAMRHLNRMAKSWSVKGMKVWQWQEASLPMVVGQEEYELGAGGDLVINKPLEIANARRLYDGVETLIDIKSRNEYMNQPSKADSAGEPVYVYFQPRRLDALLYVWPSPIAGSAVNFSYKSYIEDFDSLDNTPCFPPEWLEALVYGLAMRLCPMYEVGGQDQAHIIAMAETFLALAEESDADQGSVFIQPETIYYGNPL
jgi:hypothetical protein